jgi:hypothetical protein
MLGAVANRTVPNDIQKTHLFSGWELFSRVGFCGATFPALSTCANAGALSRRVGKRHQKTTHTPEKDAKSERGLVSSRVRASAYAAICAVIMYGSYSMVATATPYGDGLRCLRAYGGGLPTKVRLVGRVSQENAFGVADSRKSAFGGARQAQKGVTLIPHLLLTNPTAREDVFRANGFVTKPHMTGASYVVIRRGRRLTCEGAEPPAWIRNRRER